MHQPESRDQRIPDGVLRTLWPVSWAAATESFLRQEGTETASFNSEIGR